MRWRVWLGAATLVVTVQPIRAQQLHYEGAVSLTSGTYIFTERTNSWTLSTGLALTVGPVTVRGSVPMFVQNTTLLTSSAGGLVPTGGSSSGAVADTSAAHRGRSGTVMATPGGTGLPTATLAIGESADGVVDVPSTAVTGYQARAGDPVFGATASLGSGRVGLLLGANAKAPLTDTTGFGTGAWDFGGSASLSCLFGLTTLVSVGAGYWVMGDLPDLDLQNPFSVSASVSYLGLRGWGVSGSLATATAVIDGYPSSTSLSGGILRVARRQSVGLTIGVGLTDTAPDLMIGLTWRLQLTGRR